MFFFSLHIIISLDVAGFAKNEIQHRQRDDDLKYLLTVERSELSE